MVPPVSLFLWIFSTLLHPLYSYSDTICVMSQKNLCIWMESSYLLSWKSNQYLICGKLCRNWDWFVRDKPKLLRYLAEVTKRPIAMLRMDSGWKHRLKMENIEVLRSVKSSKTRFRSSTDYVSTYNLCKLRKAPISSLSFRFDCC